MPGEKVLVVEDDSSWSAIFERRLQRVGLVAIMAKTVAEAEAAFNANSDIALIAMDGSLGEEARLDTGDLVRMMRQSFKGPIIAMSSLPARRQLRDAGCDHEVEEKGDLNQKICDLLGV